MSTPTVIWMRHGTCRDGLYHPGAHPHPDSPLHPRGAREVNATATALREGGRHVALIVTSPLPRAATSASIAATVLGVRRVDHDETLREWAAPTCVLGRAASDYPQQYRAWRAIRCRDVDATLPGGESLRMVRDRTVTAMTRLADLAEREGTILAVSHRVLIGCVAATSAGVVDPAEVFTRARAISLSPAGLWPCDTTARGATACPPTSGRW